MNLAFVFAIAFGAAGCAETEPEASPPAVEAASVTSTQPLSDRAAVLWKARLDEDWSVVFSFRHPGLSADVTSEEFVSWAPENEPFVVHEYTLGESAEAGDIGWVDLECLASVRRFPKVPPQKASRVEIWERVDGVWYPVPTDQLEAYPITPKQRDAEAEAELAERFDTMWSARVENDVKTLWSLTHPSDRPAEVPSASAQPPFKMLSREVHWIEAANARGRVRVSYRVKVNDESMERLPPQDITVIEKWALFQGEWYFVP